MAFSPTSRVAKTGATVALFLCAMLALVVVTSYSTGAGNLMKSMWAFNTRQGDVAAAIPAQPHSQLENGHDKVYVIDVG